MKEFDIKRVKCSYKIDDVKEMLLNIYSDYFVESLFSELVNKSILVVFNTPEGCFVTDEEVTLCKELYELNKSDILNGIQCKSIDGSLTRQIRIQEDTYLFYKLVDSTKAIPAFIRNILYKKWSDEKLENAVSFELLGVIIKTYNIEIQQYLENVMYRKFMLDILKQRDNTALQVNSENVTVYKERFTNSSSYMGSKRKLIGFLIESMFFHKSSDTAFLDLMCGSGAVANGMAMLGTTYASDAQLFCRLLAKVQGKGFTEKKAKALIDNIYNNYHKNLVELEARFKEQLTIENKLFHMNLGNRQAILDEYEEYLKEMPLYSSELVSDKNVDKLIEERKKNHQLFPYCLFTLYFTNVFFSLEQSIQLDSIRYAIDQLISEKDKEWALGVLIIVTSQIATTYGGHFAEPLPLKVGNIDRIIRQREKPVWLEFCKRLITLARESESYLSEIRIIDGPWKNALYESSKLGLNNLVVYLDAPYKREEYSRYYHVLETMALYDYPCSEFKGRMRSKKHNERFKTEFFTKSVEKAETAFIDVISSILEMEAVCAWSYSDNGMVSALKIIEEIKARYNCNVFLYSIPHRHQGQGKRKADGKSTTKYVTEYCIIFKRTVTPTNILAIETV